MERVTEEVQQMKFLFLYRTSPDPRDKPPAADYPSDWGLEITEVKTLG